MRAQAEPTFRAQMWRTVRTLAVAFLLISGVGALVEERGIGKGILNNPDMRPQLETGTKFADVKGVDEAKARARRMRTVLVLPPCPAWQAHHRHARQCQGCARWAQASSSESPADQRTVLLWPLASTMAFSYLHAHVLKCMLST